VFKLPFAGDCMPSSESGASTSGRHHGKLVEALTQNHQQVYVICHVENKNKFKSDQNGKIEK